VGSSSIEPMFRCAGAYSLALCTYTDKKTSDNHVLTQHAAMACVNCVLPLTLTLQGEFLGFHSAFVFVLKRWLHR
jgi:hypothetical protein